MIRGVAFLTPSHERLGACANLNLVSRNRDAASSMHLELIQVCFDAFCDASTEEKDLSRRMLAYYLLITR